MKDYGRIVRTPHVAALLVAAVLSRVQIGINALALILLLKETTGSFATGGIVAGALSLGSGIGAPVWGRAVDRFGARTVIFPVALLHCAALGGIAALAYADAPTLAMAALGLLAGFATPPTSAILRSLWPIMLRDEPRLIPTAYALDTVLIELVFIGGPLIAAALAAVTTPAAALIVSGVSLLAGTAYFSVSPLVAHRAGRKRRTEGDLLGALRSPGLQTLVLTTLPAGFCFGATEVTLPAFSDAQGSRELAGVLLAVWSAASAAAGLAFGVIPRRRHIADIHLRLALLLPLGYFPLAFAPSVWVMGLLLIVAGATVAPLIASRNELVGAVATSGSETEAFTWPVTALVGGIAIGASVAGALVEGPGWEAGFLAAGVAAVLGAIVSVLRRGTLAPQAQAQTT